MSDFQKHNWYAIGASAIVLIASIRLGTKFDISLILALAVYLGANFPDLDTGSTPSKYAARFAMLVSIYSIYIEKPMYGLIACLVFIAPKISDHRGWTHKFITPVLITAVIYWLFKQHTLIAIAFSVGLLIHYYIDKMNPFQRGNWV